VSARACHKLVMRKKQRRNEEKMKNYLKTSAEKISIELSERQLEQFNVFYELLVNANKFFNLTAITEMHEVVLKHFIDSIAISKFRNLSNSRVIDIGTGAGFPGIPLAIIYPNAEFVLLDSLKKRLNFIDKVLLEIGVKNVTTIHGRAEDVGKNPIYREQFDICVSRAVASLPILLELCIPLVKVGGEFISYKSELLQEEILKAKRAMTILHTTLKEQFNYSIPDTDFYRVFAIFTKDEKLENKYPRQAGKLQKSPL